ncbi:MAG TPA: hypothetical protein PLB91_00070 [Spirochaetales bacterium]|nr:hypothetical protein [Spirochaetales bacterium]HRY53931.1 hypothetical protein [Spirochaetia bacterium]HRZ64106.1 hypothetical protein [Spirochaetia bacterium]
MDSLYALSRPAALRLAAFHAALALAALASSPAAAIAAAAVSALALLRYLAMAAFASSLGRARGTGPAIPALAWAAAFMALALALALVGRLSRPSLPWAAAAALAGPAWLSGEALASALRPGAACPGGSR